jgi:predicted nuclease of predicted toxin-antitoxin system
MIIFDENVGTYWIELINSKGYEYYSIRENHPGMSDKGVINIVSQLKGLLIAEDKDFGELLFAHDFEKVSVMFLRYDQPNYAQIENYVLKCIDDYFKNPEICFITISKNKIRSRKF